VTTSALSYAAWSVLALATALVWARSRRPHSSPARPTVVLQRLTTGSVVRVALVAGWAFTGWHLVAR
jgi:Family of unknown function (DUF6186)